MRYISVRHGTVKHSGEILRSQENVMWVDEYLQGDEWKVRGEGEEQVVLTRLITLSISNFVPFPRLEHKLSGLHR